MTKNGDMDQWTENHPMRMISLFSGYDAMALALDRLSRIYPDFHWELVAWADIEPTACKAHDILHPEGRGKNLGDVSKVDWEKIPKCDLLFYSPPCQSISNAGKQHGIAEGSGTRSALMWFVEPAVRALRPKYMLMEEVASLTSEKFRPDCLKWMNRLEGLGYKNFVSVLNAKDYGIPQNRERVFLVSIRDDGDDPRFYFPTPFALKKRLRDVLETEVDDKYYLSADRLDGLAKSTIEEALKGREPETE